jgi:ubiquinone/menaquinone biosynthesis C-methylase UbiE
MPATLTPVANYWPQSRCAKAFWGQQHLPAYQALLTATQEWLDPHPGERWLDLGCGGGRLTEAVWERSRGAVAEVMAMDCAAANEKAIRKLCDRLEPRPPHGCLHFVENDFSRGLGVCDSDYFDGVVSGMALQYAESYSEEEGRWTCDAYDHALAEVYRVLAPGGRFVVSLNVPNPSWGRVAFWSIYGFFTTLHPVKYLKNAWRMWNYGSWLKKQADIGRFHYLPIETIAAKLTALGFTHIEHRLSYAGQAYLIRCRKE